MEIRLLGKVTVLVNGHEVDTGADRQRCVLVALAVDAGRVVSTERLTERVWGDEPPLRARATLLNYLSRLRHALEAAGVQPVVRRTGGYVLDAAPATVDLHRFRDLCAQARAHTDDDRHQVYLLEQALALWRGEALTGLGGGWAAGERDRMHRERLAAEYDLTDVLLRLGHGEDLVAGLAARAAESPLDERIAGQYMLALYRAGRTADALAHYRHTQTQLVEGLGCDPGPALRELHQQVLAADPKLSATPRDTFVARVPVPRQLPAVPGPLIGREQETDRLDAALSADSASTIVIYALAGIGGIGKTQLALHWAHRHLDRFPDGQLFVDLRGFSPEGQPMDPVVAVRGFLDALNVAPDRIPAAPHGQAALFRSLMAGKRMLVMLDNAASTAQVIPLLPGSATCTVVITSRHHLTGLLATQVVHHMPLDALADAEAGALLANRLGQARLAAEPMAAHELIEFCGGFPLALSIVASQAATRPQSSLAELAAELRGLGLSALDGPEPAASLPAVLSWSLQHLTDEQRHLFALLGIAPGPDISLPAAASLAGLSERETHAMLRALAEVSLVDRTPGGRYGMHDLVRAYATTVADNLSSDIREPALRRILDFYTHTAHAAELLLRPSNEVLRPDPPAPGVRPMRHADIPAALVWFENEHACLLAAQHTAATLAWHLTVWHLAWNLSSFHLRRGHGHDQFIVWQNAGRAAAHLSDPAIRIHTYLFLGLAHAELSHHEEAIDHLHQALALAEHQPDVILHARIHKALAWAWEHRGDLRQALVHAHHSLDLFRALDRPEWVADGLSSVGWYAALVRDYDTARQHCQAALTLFRRHNDSEGESVVLDSLGYIDHHTGRHIEAIDHYQQALVLYRDDGSTYHVASTLDRLGHAHAALGQTGQASTVWREALQLYQHQGRDQDAQRMQEQLTTLDLTGRHEQPG